MHPARGVNVGQRQSEKRPPGERRQPAPKSSRRVCRAAADDVIPGVDRLEERVEMGSRPGLGRRRDQYDRLIPAREALLECLVPAQDIGSQDEGLGLPLAGLEQVEQPLADRVRVGVVVRGHDEHQNFAIRDRLANRGGVEGVDPVVTFVGRHRAFRTGKWPHTYDA
jgi:hypothetical protein